MEIKIKRALSVLCAIVILCAAVCVFADGVTSLPNNERVSVWTNNYHPYSCINILPGNDYPDTHVWFCTTANVGDTSGTFWFIADYPDAQVQNIYGSSEPGNVQGLFGLLNQTTYNGHDYYYYGGSSLIGVTIDQTVYYNKVANLQDALSILDPYYRNDSTGSVSRAINYTLPAGNVAYLEIDNSTFNGVNLATTMPYNSTQYGSDPWPLSSQFYAMTDSILGNGDSVYSLNGTKINWQISSNAGTNIFGNSSSAVWSSTGPYPAKKYFVVCNPYYADPDNNNGSITILANGIISIRVQPLRSNYITDGNTTTFNTVTDGGTYEGEVTDDLGPIDWTDPDGGTTAPGTSTSNTPVTGVSQFQSWLQEFLDKIISVFEPAHDAITTLSSTIQNFASWMKALYIWLPTPVLSLLTSAISLAIIIGVLKVFI